MSQPLSSHGVEAAAAASERTEAAAAASERTEAATLPLIGRILVVGAGTMGAGIAQVAAVSGTPVTLVDLDEGVLNRGVTAIRQSLDKFVSKGKMGAPVRDAVLERLESRTDLEAAAATADLVIEAVTERIEVKKELFARLDRLCPPATMLATNTSSLSVTEMAMVTGRPDRVLGLHFFNPPALMKLVEVVRTPHTSEATFQACWALVERMHKTPVLTRDTPGFIFNRLIIPYLNEALWAVYEGVGSVRDIDRAMVLGGNMPIGPLSLLDMIGLDVQLHACSAMFEQFGDPKFRPCPLNRQMVRAGYFGRKSGKGFYDYSSSEPTPVDLSAFRE